MATLTAAYAKTATLTAAATDTVTLTTSARFVRIAGRDLTGQLEAWVTVDGAVFPFAATPAIGGDDVAWLGPRDVLVVETPQTGPTVVRITSAGAYPYTVALA